jgi:anti-sigma factor RsiW
MNHHNSAEEIALQAALHALGVLPEEEALAFKKHLAEGCDECQREVASYQSTVEKLGFGAPAAEPSADLADRLLQAVKEQPKLQLAPAPGKTEPGGSLTIRADEGEWREKWKGVFIKRLFKDDDKGTPVITIAPYPAALMNRCLPSTAPCF